MDVEVERYLDALVARAGAVLGEQLVGAYATGSVALDDYRPGRSDIDVALVCESPLDEAVKHELARELRHESLPCPARGLELVVYRRAVARSGTPEPGFELELNTGAGMRHRVTYRPEDRAEADGLFWYGLDRGILHQHGLRLTGPPAGEVFAEPALAETRRLLLTALRWWLQAPALAAPMPSPGAEEAVLGGCRALLLHRSGQWTAKSAAGRWLVASGHDAAGLVERALAARDGGPPPAGLAAQTFLRQVVDEIASPTPPGQPAASERVEDLDDP